MASQKVAQNPRKIMRCKLAQADLSGRSVVCFRTLISLGVPLISRISFDGNVSFKSKRTAHTELPPLPASTTPSADPPSSSTQAQYFVLIMYFVLIIPGNIVFFSASFAYQPSKDDKPGS